MLRGTFVFILVFLSFSIFSKEYYSEHHGLRPQWLKLLHYKSGLFGYKSEADGKGFFYAKNGRKNPTSEYEANVAAFKDNKKDYLCRFPARSFYLAENLDETMPNFDHCRELNEFFNKFEAKSISLVFSSYFLDTPASAFGHTLLRFSKHKEKDSERYELLDYAANYSAVVTTGNALIYAIMGMFGGFKGEFATMPYFYKVREYNDFESRDIWDYELDLTQEQVDKVLYHLWEMKWTHFDYWYLDENCSYHMLGLLDVANPDWDLTGRISNFVIPVDTIKLIAETPGLLRKISYRPSKKRIVDARIKRLSPEETQILSRVYQSKDPSSLKEGLKAESKARILDAAIDLFDFMEAEDVLLEKSEANKQKRKFLIARAKTKAKTPKLKIHLPEKEIPHKTHDSTRIGLGAGYDSKLGTFTKAQWRFALHDFLDPLEGQNPGSSMEMGRFTFRYQHEIENRGDKSWFQMDEFSFVEVKSLSPINNLFTSISWRAFLGAKTERDFSCDYCFAPIAELGAGYSLGGKDLLVYGMLVSKLQIHKEFSKSNLRPTLGPEVSLISRKFKRMYARLHGAYFYHPGMKKVKQSFLTGMDLRFIFTQNFTWQLSHTLREGQFESEGRFYLAF